MPDLETEVKLMVQPRLAARQSLTTDRKENSDKESFAPTLDLDVREV